MALQGGKTNDWTHIALDACDRDRILDWETCFQTETARYSGLADRRDAARALCLSADAQ